MATAGIIIIGNEVLSGKVEDANARFLIGELRLLGVELVRMSFLRDDVQAIADEVRWMSEHLDHVITSGGVGATHDDVTFEGVALGLGLPLEVNAELEALLEAHYKDRMNDAVRRMATVPRGSVLLGRGQLLHPLVSTGKVYIFPGVPSFLQAKFEVLRDRLRGQPFVLREVFARVGEDRLALHLSSTVEAHPGLEIGSYPRFDEADHRVRITLESRDAELVEAGLRTLLARLDPGWVVRVQ